MSIAKKIKSALNAAVPPPPTTAELWHRHNQAGFALDAAQEKYRNAARLAEIHPGDPTALDALKATQQERDAAQDRLDQITAAIEAQQAIERSLTEAEAAAENARRWDQAEAAAARRVKAAEDVENACSALADAQVRLIEASDDMRLNAPVELDHAATIANQMLVVSVTRLQGVKAGIKWAATWPWGAEKLPTLTGVIAKANDELKRARAKATAKV